MFGKNRKLVPTKWSITATDQIISNDLMHNILDFDIIDTYGVFNFDHLGNLFSVILFPHIPPPWMMFCSIGIPNVAVFPVPVCA